MAKISESIREQVQWNWDGFSHPDETQEFRVLRKRSPMWLTRQQVQNLIQGSRSKVGRVLYSLYINGAIERKPGGRQGYLYRALKDWNN